jgi:Tfp pilus assembly protein PilP
LIAKELTCPKPTVPKKEIYLTNQEKENEYRPKGERKKAFLK